MAKHLRLFIFLFIFFLVISGVLAYVNYEKSNKIEVQGQKINESMQKIEELLANVQQKEQQISELNQTVLSKEQTISQQQKEIVSTTIQLEETEQIAKTRQAEIQRLKEVQQRLNEEGKLIVDNYGGTLILYDDVEIYEAQSQYAEMLKNDPVNYGSLGMPFIYFKDESKEIEEGTLLGSYSTLYNYIFIFKDNKNVRTLYHEIAHLLYFRYFIEVENNLDIWLGLYSELKANDLLSTEYSKFSPEEGFAEEYSVYKTGIKDQPQVVKDLFKQVDAIVD